MGEIPLVKQNVYIYKHRLLMLVLEHGMSERLSKYYYYFLKIIMHQSVKLTDAI